MPTAIETAKIKHDIAQQGVTFTNDSEEQRRQLRSAPQVSRNATNQALAKTNGRSAVDRGGLGDEGIKNVASVGTGIGGNHPDGRSRSGRRPHTWRAKARA